MSNVKTVADLIRELEDYSGDPSTTTISLTLGGMELDVASIVGYPDHAVMVLKPRTGA